MSAEQKPSRNLGVVAIPEMPREKWCAGVIAVMYDEDGNYSTVWKGQSMDLPAPEIREEIGSLASHAFEVANCPGLEV